jgi:hypothetical protein
MTAMISHVHAWIKLMMFSFGDADDRPSAAASRAVRCSIARSY